MARMRRSQRRDRTVFWVVLVVIVGGLLAGYFLSKPKPSSHSATTVTTDTSTALFKGPAGPEGVPLEIGDPLAAAAAASGATIDGVSCIPGEQVVYHIHAHLTIFVNGSLRPIPGGIGMVAPSAQQSSSGAPFFSATNCYYWMHVHAQDGVIHVESPASTTYTLGQFFAIWRQPLNRTHVGSVSGTVTVFVNGKRYSGDPARIALKAHEDIQIDVGKVVPPEKIDWSASTL